MVGAKILLTTYSSAFLTSGGAESEMVQLEELLRENGCQADIYGIGSRPLQNYDALMHFSVEPDGESLVRIAHSKGKKIFLWPNIWWHSVPSPTELARVRDFVGMATCLFFKSETEREHFYSLIGHVDVKNHVFRPVVSNTFMDKPDSALFEAVCDLESYILCIGLIEPTKNQLPLIHALNTLGLPGLFVGGFRDVDYFRECRDAAGPSVKFLPFLQPRSDLLRSVIAKAHILAEPSFDPPGRSCLEGALMCRPIVVQDSPWAREHFGDSLYYASGGDEAAIRAAIENALVDERRSDRVKQVYKRILDKHTGSKNILHLLEIIVQQLQ